MNTPVASLSRAYPDISSYRIMPQRFWGRWFCAALVALLLFWLVRAFAQGQIEWHIVGEFLTAKIILHGLVATIVMAVAAMTLGILLGMMTAVMHLSPNPLIKAVAVGYAWFFRGTPLILQLLLWFNLALVFPTIGIPGLWETRTVTVMTPMLAALLGLGINQGAYTSEVIRAGLLSVDTGQHEAAKSIGMTKLHLLRRIVFPQAMRVILPPLGNEFISMVKMTSLASVIQFTEILHAAQSVYYANNRVIELLIVAAVWYLLVVSILTPLQMLFERRYAKGTRAST